MDRFAVMIYKEYLLYYLNGRDIKGVVHEYTLYYSGKDS